MAACLLDVPENIQAPNQVQRILVVEDNLINQRVSKSLLQRLGYTVDIAADGLEGVSMWQAGSYDAVIMDCHMPVLDGYSATEQIRQKEQTESRPRLPIIALTAHCMEDNRQKCFASGMDDFLTKPVDFNQLKDTIGRWLGNERQSF